MGNTSLWQLVAAFFPRVIPPHAKTFSRLQYLTHKILYRVVGGGTLRYSAGPLPAGIVGKSLCAGRVVVVATEACNFFRRLNRYVLITFSVKSCTSFNDVRNSRPCLLKLKMVSIQYQKVKIRLISMWLTLKINDGLLVVGVYHIYIYSLYFNLELIIFIIQTSMTRISLKTLKTSKDIKL